MKKTYLQLISASMTTLKMHKMVL